MARKYWSDKEHEQFLYYRLINDQLSHKDFFEQFSGQIGDDGCYRTRNSLRNKLTKITNTYNVTKSERIALKHAGNSTPIDYNFQNDSWTKQFSQDRFDLEADATDDLITIVQRTTWMDRNQMMNYLRKVFGRTKHALSTRYNNQRDDEKTTPLKNPKSNKEKPEQSDLEKFDRDDSYFNGKNKTDDEKESDDDEASVQRSENSFDESRARRLFNDIRENAKNEKNDRKVQGSVPIRYSYVLLVQLWVNVIILVVVLT